MPNTVIDTLEVKITANAMTAAKALDSLANSLKNVRAVLNNTNKAGASIGDKLAKNIHELNNAMTRINNDGIKKLQFLSNALNSYANAAGKVKAAGALGSAAKDIKKISDATTVKDGLVPNGKDSSKVDDAVPKVKRIGDAFKSAGQKVKDFSKNLNFGATAIGKLFRMVGRIALYRAIRTALKAISEAFSEGLKNAYAYSQQSDTFKELAETLDRVKTATYQMTNQLGALLGEIKQLLAPIVEWLIEKIRWVAEKLTELFAALNGKSTYLRAKQVAQTWGDAADNAKKFKQQLLGIDEINNLTTKKDTTTDPKDMYEEVGISSKIKDIAEDYTSLKKKLEGIFTDYRNVLLVGVGLLAIGAIFTFFTTKKLLGLGLMLASGLLIGKTVMENKEQLYNDVRQAMEKYRWLFAAGAIGLTAIGAALLFTGHWKLGLGCILGGVAIGATTVIMNWELMYNDVKAAMEKYRWLFYAGSIALAAIGAALIFTQHYALGLGCILAGVSLGVYTIAMSWEKTYNDIANAFESYAPLFAITGTAMAVIGLLLLSTGHIGLGLGILVAGSYLSYETIKFNWDSIFDSVQEQWGKIVSWWNSHVKGKINEAANWIETTFHIDLNGDGQYGGLRTDFKEYSLKGGAPYANTQEYLKSQGVTPTELPSSLRYDSIGAALNYTAPTFGEKTEKLWNNTFGYENVKKIVSDTIEDIGTTINTLADNISSSPIGEIGRWIEKKAPILFEAGGGLVGQGSLFYAGEAGPEFVGSMGGTSAVANTEQMTEAIYKAAYMGMSQALRENGGSNGLAGFVPASTDDLFIAMRKKASSYNKMTGNSAFA